MKNKLAILSQKLSPNLRKIIANTSWLFADKFLEMGLGLVVGIWVARYLGPEEYGIFNYAIAFVSLFEPIVKLGLDSIAVRDLISEPSRKGEILGTAFALKIATGFLTFFCSVGIIQLLRPEDKITHWLVGLVAAGTVFQAFGTIDFWFQSQTQSKNTVLAKNAGYIISTLVKIALIQTQATLIAFAWLKFADTVLLAIGLVISYRLNGNDIKAWRVSIARVKAFLGDSWPLMISSATVYVQARIDQIMIGQMIGDSEVGQYSVAIKLIEMLGFIPIVCKISYTPAITKAKAQDEQLYYDRFLNVYRFMFILFLITAVPIFLLSEQIVVTLFGEEYRSAGFLLSLSATRLLFANFGTTRGLYMINENMSQHLLVSGLMGSVANVGLNSLLIPKYSSIGAIWATIASLSVTVFFADLLLEKTRQNLKLMLTAIISPCKIRF